MIVYFPTFYEDETVYSLCARYYVKSGYLSYIDAAEDLYADKRVRPDLEFIDTFTEDALKILTKNADMKEIIKLAIMVE